jgi:hypothetical protein
VRHHGPGSARSVGAALDAIRPDSVLVEGPPDADDLMALIAHTDMRPPVALLVYRPDEPKRAVFFPFAAFSPEWTAIRWAYKNQVPVRFMDLPQRHWLALEPEKEADAAPDENQEERKRRDPFALIAEAAGYSDGERWWEEQFEKRHAGPDIFTAVIELMTAFREGQPLEPLDAKREAWMRQTLREEQKLGRESVALVCGAWHAPALATLPTVKSDTELLRGMPKVNVAATWMPWTHRRLTYASGYGAGIHSPGYYEHLWTLADPASLSSHWMTRVARLLRGEDLEGSPASIIEATRLADAMASMRGFAMPGLAEFNDSAQAVFCFGDATPMKLIRERLIVGDALGAVPDQAPQVPLQRDFQKETKRLRLTTEALDRTLDLDLRKPNDLDRSRLLHRLRILRVDWGTLAQARGKGTFRETWKLRWEPELEVALIEAAPWGNTVEEATARFAIDRAMRAENLPELTTLIQVVLLSELRDAVEPVMRQLENKAALTSDVNHLMDALPPLATVLRYGDVRQTDTSMIGHILTGLVARVCAGLPPACSSLSAETAAEIQRRINNTHSSLTALVEEPLRQPWIETLRKLAEEDTVHGLVTGRNTRILLDDTVIDAGTVATRLSRHLSRANAPAQAAAWLEGFLSGSGLVLLHQPTLWGLLDAWLSSLTADHFTETMPLLRRTFATFPMPERRQMGELAKQGDGTVHLSAPAGDDIDESRANRILPTLAALLGIQKQ